MKKAAKTSASEPRILIVFGRRSSWPFTDWKFCSILSWLSSWEFTNSLYPLRIGQLSMVVVVLDEMNLNWAEAERAKQKIHWMIPEDLRSSVIISTGCEEASCEMNLMLFLAEKITANVVMLEIAADSDGSLHQRMRTKIEKLAGELTRVGLLLPTVKFV